MLLLLENIGSMLMSLNTLAYLCFLNRTAFSFLNISTISFLKGSKDPGITKLTLVKRSVSWKQAYKKDKNTIKNIVLCLYLQLVGSATNLWFITQRNRRNNTTSTDIVVMNIFLWNFFLRKSFLKQTFCIIDQNRITSIVASFPIIFITHRNRKKFVSKAKFDFIKESWKENFSVPSVSTLWKISFWFSRHFS